MWFAHFSEVELHRKTIAPCARDILFRRGKWFLPHVNEIWHAHSDYIFVVAQQFINYYYTGQILLALAQDQVAANFYGGGGARWWWRQSRPAARRFLTAKFHFASLSPCHSSQFPTPQAEIIALHAMYSPHSYYYTLYTYTYYALTKSPCTNCAYTYHGGTCSCWYASGSGPLEPAKCYLHSCLVGREENHIFGVEWGLSVGPAPDQPNVFFSFLWCQSIYTPAKYLLGQAVCTTYEYGTFSHKPFQR